MAGGKGGFFVGFIKFLFFLLLICGVAYGGFVYGQLTLKESLVEVEFPIKQTFDFDLKQTISIPIKTEVSFPVHEAIVINEAIPINAVIPIDEVVSVPVSFPDGVIMVDIPIKKNIPISTSFNVSKTIYIDKNVSVKIDKEFPFLVEKTITVPIDTVIKAKIPTPEWMKE